MNADPAVVVVGDLVTDIVAVLTEPLAIGSDATATIRTTGGGSGANVAAWLAWSGLPVAFAGRVGDDPPGGVRIRELVELGVDVRAAIDAGAPTGTVLVLVTPDGERTMVPDRGANANLTPADLDDTLFAAGRHLHLSGYTLLTPSSRDAGLQALARARAAGMTISVDPASTAPLESVEPATFLEWTAGAEVCLPNAAEATVLSGTTDLEQAARHLTEHFGQVVVTTGGDGAIWTDGDQLLHEPAAAVHRRDTTGAGDAFTAGFLAALLTGHSPREALRRGNDLAGHAVTLLGARPSDPGAT